MSDWFVWVLLVGQFITIILLQRKIDHLRKDTGDTFRTLGKEPKPRL